MRKYLSVFLGVSLAVAHMAPGEFQDAGPMPRCVISRERGR